MKKRIVSMMMVSVLIGLSVMIWPVSAESTNVEPLNAVEEAATASTNLFTLSQTKKLMGVGTTATLSTVPATTALWSSSDSSVVSVNAITGQMQALKRGTATITASYTFADGGTFSQSCQVAVLEEVDVLDEEYYIKYNDKDRYIYPVSNDPALGAYLRVTTKMNTDLQRWIITKNGDTYLIKSDRNNMYLGISPSNIALPTLYSEISDLTKWKFYKYGGACIIAPYMDSYTNGRVLSPSSNQPDDHGYVGLLDYFDNSVYRYWFLECVRTYLLNYYEYSINNNPTLTNSIVVANQFVQSYFDMVLGHDVYMVGTPSYYADLWVNQCACNNDLVCTNSTNCDLHHRNYNRYYRETGSIPLGFEQKLIMWANHPASNFYCTKNSDGEHSMLTVSLAECQGKRVRIFTYGDNPDWNTDASASLILAHEIGHAFGLPEMYDLYPDTHSRNGDMVCVMQQYGYVRAERFYDQLRKDCYGNITDENIINAFCDTCWEMLVNNVDIS